MERTRVSYEADHQRQAKAERKWLFTIDVNGIPGKLGGRQTLQGPADEKAIKLIKALFKKLCEEDLV